MTLFTVIVIFVVYRLISNAFVNNQLNNYDMKKLLSEKCQWMLARVTHKLEEILLMENILQVIKLKI